MTLTDVDTSQDEAPRSARARRRQKARRSNAAVPRRSMTGDTNLARGLGWLSLGLGAVEVAAPRRVATFLGLAKNDGLLRLLGLREIAAGLGIFAQPRPTTALWARLGGDVADLALLLAALPASTRRGRVLGAIAAVGGVTALDAIAADRFARRSARGAAPSDGSVEVVESVAVNASPADAYAYWRRLEQLPTFMKNLQSVEQSGKRRSHWVASAPGGGTVEWEAEITEDVPDERISWRSLAGASVPNSGSVRFTADPAGRGTVVEADLRYDPPLGGAGTLVATLFGKEPSQQVKEDLRRFKQMIETGEIPTTEGQSSGRRSHAVTGRRPTESRQPTESREARS